MSFALLREQALRYLAGRDATVQRLRQVLLRKLRTAEVEPEAGRSWVDDISREFTEIGYVNDQRLSRLVVRGLTAQGKSKAQVRAKMRERGFTGEDISVAVEPLTGADELGGALLHLKRRHGGPFERDAGTLAPLERMKVRSKHLGALGRAGFPFDVADRALRMNLEEATDYLDEHSKRRNV